MALLGPMGSEFSTEGFTVTYDGLVIKFNWGDQKTQYGLHDVEMMMKGAEFTLMLMRLACDFDEWEDMAMRVPQAHPKEPEGKLYVLEGGEE